MRSKKGKAKDGWKKLKDFNEEKKDALKRTKAVASFIEISTVEDQRSFFTTTYDKAFEVWASAIDMHQKKGKKEHKEITLLMNVLKGILTFCGDSIKSKSGHQAIIADFLKKGLYKENKMPQRESAFSLLLLFINSFDKIEPDTPQDSYTALIPSAVDLNVFAEHFRGRVNRGKWNNVLSAGADMTDVLLPASSSAAAKRNAKEEALTLLGNFLDFIGDHKFKLWFEILKEYFIKIFYADVAAEIGLQPAGKPVVGFLGYAPHEVQGAIVERLIRWPAESRTSSVIWDDELNTRLVMSLFLQGVSITEDYSIVKKFVNGFHNIFWQPLAPPPSFTSHLFDLRKEYVQVLKTPFEVAATGSHVEDQVTVCLDVLSLFKAMIENPGDIEPALMREFVQDTLLETTTKVIGPASENLTLQSRLANVAVETIFRSWIRSNTQDPKMWDKLQQTVSGLFHVLEPIQEVKKILVALTYIRVGAVYPEPKKKKPKPGRAPEPAAEDKLTRPDINILGVEWTGENVTFMWNNVFNVLQGVNRLEDPKAHELAMQVITEVMDMMIQAESVAPYLQLTEEGRDIPELLEVFGPLLFEACALPVVQDAGKSQAFYALCRLVVRHHYRPYPLSFLVHFYRIVKDALLAQDHPLPIFTIIRNSSDIFVLGLEGSSVLIPLYLLAAKFILTADGRTGPQPPAYVKEHALKVLNSLVTFSSAYDSIDLPLDGLSTKEKVALGLDGSSHTLIASMVKNIINDIMLDALSNLSGAGHKVQCLCGVCLMIFDEVFRPSPDTASIEKWILTLLEYTGAATSLPDVIRVAFDALSSLILVEPQLQELVPVVPTVVNYLCSYVQKEVSASSIDVGAERVISRHLSCIGEWIINSTPGIFNDEALCATVFDTINMGLFGDHMKDVPSGQFWQLFNKLMNRPKHGSMIVRSAAEGLLFYLSTHHNNFPCKAGISVSSSSILETHDTEEKDPTKSLLFVLHNTFVISLIEVPQETGPSIARIIVRDPIGKHVWDSKISWGSLFEEERPDNVVSLLDTVPSHEDPTDGGPRILDSVKGDAGDKVNELLSTLLSAHEDVDTDFTKPAEPHVDLSLAFEQMERQFNEQAQITRDHVQDLKNEFTAAVPPKSVVPELPYHVCRTLLNHLGFLDINDTGASAAFTQLENSDKSRRTIAQLDKSSGREALKIGVIYVKYSQDDQGLILRNDSTMREPLFTHFLRGLGWPVRIEHHPGYTGGLDKVNLSTGEETPYYANHLLEVIFHDITSMPTVDGDSQQIQKKRHVGNDIVHIVYSEHARDYSPKTITSQFNDAHIVIYPLKNGLFRTQVFRKDKVPLFGPLQDGMVMTKQLVAMLARATAINANRAVRYTTDGYKAPFPTRRQYIADLTDKYKVEKRMNSFLSAVVLGSNQ